MRLERAFFGFGYASAAALVVLGACHTGGAKFPWAEGQRGGKPIERVDVHTLNEGYARTRSQVLVREVARPTRAALDYAAYHANFMIADPEPEAPLPAAGVPDTSHPFSGQLELGTLTGDLSKTSLSQGEQQHALAFAPLSEFLQARKVAGAEALTEVGSAVRREQWGLKLPPGTSGQQLSELYLHEAQGAVELWAKVEFQPWFTQFKDAPDQDGDGFPELYGRVAQSVVTPGLVSAIQKDYAEPVLSPAEVKGWANQLSSYWYPSFNTDLIPPGPTWPDEQTEADIKHELGARSFASPTFVLRGKPQGKATYNVFLVSAAGAEPQAASAPSKPALRLAKTRPTPAPKVVAERVQSELSAQGGSWPKWMEKVAPVQEALKKRLKAMPPKVKALAGRDGFLFYRNDLEYVTGGDLEKQRKGKNPLPVIVEFKKLLDAQGVDFLFVPVPTKLEIYPEQLDPKLKSVSGEVINPAFRKLLASLASEGVEVLDLLPALLQAKSGGGPDPLFQHQDTHWTDRGLRLTADLLTARVKKYPWYQELAKQKRSYDLRETSFTRFGDLQSRLPEAEQKKYKPETLVAHQVLAAGKPYDDDPDSPVVLLGDSFTGVYELTDAEHAGVSAHIARGIGYPLDLVMSYGGGPNVRQKLMRRGVEALTTKKLVIWMMTARDLFNYWEDWESLNKP
jgi:acetyltransferase AlgX (SGNH hydrolase-like protein)